MNSDDQLRKELQQLGRLMTPDRGFVDRVMDQLEPEPRSLISLRWAAIAVAASVLLALGWMALMHQSAQLNDDAGPLVRSSTEWQTVSERPVTLEGEIPAREISRQTFERVKWEDPRRHATFERVVPREKVTFVTLENY